MKDGRVLDTEVMTVGMLAKSILSCGLLCGGPSELRFTLECPECGGYAKYTVDTNKKNYVTCKCCKEKFKIKGY
jgi:hypothetical protein